MLNNIINLINYELNIKIITYNYTNIGIYSLQTYDPKYVGNY